MTGLAGVDVFLTEVQSESFARGCNLEPIVDDEAGSMSLTGSKQCWDESQVFGVAGVFHSELNDAHSCSQECET